MAEPWSTNAPAGPTRFRAALDRFQPATADDAAPRPDDAPVRGKQRRDVAPVGREFGNLLTTDQRTDIAGLCLNLQRVGLHRDGLPLAADRESNVLLDSLGHVHNNVRLRVLLEA